MIENTALKSREVRDMACTLNVWFVVVALWGHRDNFYVVVSRLEECGSCVNSSLTDTRTWHTHLAHYQFIDNGAGFFCEGVIIVF